MSAVELVKEEFAKKGPVVDIVSHKDGEFDGHYVYMVYNGTDIAQIGMGSSDRQRNRHNTASLG